MALFHFSENPAIEKFVPRAPLAHPEAEPMVWAIDDWHSPLYYLPSECPRVCFWPLPSTSPSDLALYWPDEKVRMVTAVESRWASRIVNASIYRYVFAEAGFIDCEDHGVFVCPSTVVPVAVEPVGPALQAFEKANVELRLCPSLVGLAEQMMQTSLHWSCIRMRNAEGWNRAKGQPTMPRC